MLPVPVPVHCPVLLDWRGELRAHHFRAKHVNISPRRHHWITRAMPNLKPKNIVEHRDERAVGCACVLHCQRPRPRSETRHGRSESLLTGRVVGRQPNMVDCEFRLECISMRCLMSAYLHNIGRITVT